MLGEGGEPVAVTIGNDVSSRDIEGANPLYIPQAKIFAGACAIGPALAVPDDWDAPFAIRLRITDADGTELFAGETSTGEDEAHARASSPTWVVRDNPIPPGSVLLTGTGLVPPDDYTLEPGHVVEIEIEGIGVLANTVAAGVDRDTDADGVTDDRSTSTHPPARPAGTTSAAPGCRRLRRDLHEASTRCGRREIGRRVLRRRARPTPTRPSPPRQAAFAGWAALPMARRGAYLDGRGGRARGARRADRARHDDRDGQAAARGARRGRRAPRRSSASRRARRSAPVGEHFEQAATGAQVSTRRRPVGVVGADHAVELPDRDPDLEARARARSTATPSC